MPIPIIIIEDSDVTPEILNFDFVEKYGDFHFDPSPVKKIVSPGDYEWYVGRLSELRGQAVVFVDLEMSLGGVSEWPTEMAAELLEILDLPEYKDSVINKAGYRFIYELLLNEDWQGLLVLASTGINKEVSDGLREWAKQNPRIAYWEGRTLNNSNRGLKHFQEGLDAALEKFSPNPLAAYLNGMSKLTSEDCHHDWGDTKEPRPLALLSKLLRYDSGDELLLKLGYARDGRVYPGKGSGIADALKELGPQGSGKHVAPSAILLLAWAAYRNAWPNEVKDDSKFSEAWRIADRQGTRMSALTRGCAVIPPQPTLEDQQRCCHLVYDFFTEFFKADRDRDELNVREGEDLLKNVIWSYGISPTAALQSSFFFSLSIDVSMNGIELHNRLNIVTEKRRLCQKFDNHTLSQRILSLKDCCLISIEKPVPAYPLFGSGAPFVLKLLDKNTIRFTVCGEYMG